MTLPIITKEFMDSHIVSYEREFGQLDREILTLFNTFNNPANLSQVLIKVAALNQLYSTSIVYIDPVAKKIRDESVSFVQNDGKNFIDLVDKVSSVSWKNKNEKEFTRNNLSFSSKYVYFLSGRKVPIYDSYIWILMIGYLGQSNGDKMTFSPPNSYLEFYKKYMRFKEKLDLLHYTTYQIDKFLWQYCRSLLDETIDLEKAKSHLKQQLKDGAFP